MVEKRCKTCLFKVLSEEDDPCSGCNVADPEELLAPLYNNWKKNNLWNLLEEIKIRRDFYREVGIIPTDRL
jgi:hypothetical protein